MTKTTKVKAQRSPKQTKQKLVQMMRELEKSTTLASASKSPGSCARHYCI